MDNDPASEEAKRAFDSLRYPLKGAGRSSYAIEMQPTVAEAYHAMLARVRKVSPKLMKLPLIAGPSCLLLYHLVVARLIPDGARPLVLLLYIAPIAGVYLYIARQVATFNRTLPRGVSLTFMRLCSRIPDLRGNVILFVYSTIFFGCVLLSWTLAGS